MLKMKISTTEGGTIVAVCDSELIGKTIKDNKSKACLDLNKYAKFYAGSDIDERDMKAKRQLEIALKYAKSINLVGKRSVEYIKGFGYKIDDAKLVNSVPHLQIYKLAESL